MKIVKQISEKRRKEFEKRFPKFYYFCRYRDDFDKGTWISKKGLLDFQDETIKQTVKMCKKRIKSWANRTHPITYRVTNLDPEPPEEIIMEAVNKQALLNILKEL